MTRRANGPVSLVLGTALASTTAYLLALLFAYVFGMAGVKRHHVETASYLFAAAATLTAFTRRGRLDSAVAAPVGSPWPMLVAWLVIASGLLYGNTLVLGLFSDDFVLADRALTGRWTAEGAFVRPLPAALWACVLSITRSPVALHALNVVLHGINAALVSLLARRFDVGARAALAAGLLFLTFPGSVEAVAWPAAVHDLLVTACALGFLLLSQRSASPRQVIAAAAVLTLALLSKESALAIPVLALLLWVELPDARRTAGWPVLVVGAAVGLVYLALRMATVAIPAAYALTPTRYVVKELLARPVGMLAIPWSAVVLDGSPAIGYLWAAAVVGAAATYAWRSAKWVQPFTIMRCLAAAVFSVLPVYSMLFITPDLENARYLYLATAFWVIAVIGFVTSPGAHRIGFGATIALGVAIAVGAVGVQLHLGSWREAAVLRDRVLTAAAKAIEAAPCPTVSLAAAPDSVHGAYIFRNGLAEAVANRTAARSLAGAGDCLLAWNGSEFVPAAPGSVHVQATFRR